MYRLQKKVLDDLIAHNRKRKLKSKEMKKVLLFASALALMAGCSQDEFSIDEKPMKGQGVSFQATIDDVDTRAEWSKEGSAWKMFWYAEQDKMDFYVKDAKIANGANITAWDKTNGVATYKASRSLGEGYFVANDNSKIIGFTKDAEDKWNTPSFRYVWPTGTTVDVDATSNELVATLPAIATQDQKELTGSSTIGYAFMAGKLDKVTVPADYASGSDVLIGMELNRKLPLAVFSVKNYDKDVYGNLMSITLTSEGQVKADGKTVDDTKKENIDYGSDATWNLETDKFTEGATAVAQSIKLTFNTTSGIEWSDDATAFMTINAIDRTGATLSSRYTIEYKFDNATFTDKFDTKGNWAGGEVIRMSGPTAEPSFDLEKQPYALVGKNTDYTLLINKSFGNGKVADIMTATGVKNPGATGEIVFANIKQLKVTPNIVDPATFAKLTALTKVTLVDQTELVKDMFDAANLVNITANKVTKVDAAFNKKSVSYTDVNLASYSFADADVKAKLITSSLANADISSVSTIAPQFPSVGITFTGLTSLATIKVGADVAIGSGAFKGCTSLTDVIFPENASAKLIGASAFESCAKLVSITIPGTEVASDAFNGCKVLEIANIKDFKPAKIGANAFKDCAKIVDMNLSAATTIGAGAFEGCTKLVGNKQSSVNVLSLPVLTKLEDNTFKGCTALRYIEFNEVTSVGLEFLNGCTLTEIKFGKAFTMNGKTVAATVTSFGTIANTKIYLNSAQTGCAGNTLTLKGDADKSEDVAYTFNSIVR